MDYACDRDNREPSAAEAAEVAHAEAPIITGPILPGPVITAPPVIPGPVVLQPSPLSFPLQPVQYPAYYQVPMQVPYPQTRYDYRFFPGPLLPPPFYPRPPIFYPPYPPVFW